MITRSIVATCVLLLAGCAPTSGNTSDTSSKQASQTAPAGTDATVATRMVAVPDFTRLVEQEGAKVVNVRAVQKSKMSGKEMGDALEFLRKYFPDDQEGGLNISPDKIPNTPSTGIGSGFFISADGYLLTNAHVVDKADVVTIKTVDHKEHRAKIVGLDTRTDVALLKVSGGPFPYVKTLSSEKLKVGSWVAAIGSPFGFDNSVTAGIVSAKGRVLPDDNYLSFIQTDVAINPGNSGGPLFTMDGEVVAINTQIYSRTGGYMGMSFSIPIESALTIAEQLKKNGKVARGRMGIRIQGMSEELSKALGLSSSDGAIIAFVDPGSPAEKAGLQPGDVIIAANGNPIEAPNQLTRIAAETEVGKVLALTVIRSGKKMSLNVKVVDASEFTSASAKSSEKTELKLNPWGLFFQPGSLTVDKTTGIAAAAGIIKGDQVRRLQNQPVTSTKDIENWIVANPKATSVALLVQRGENHTFFVLDLTDTSEK